MKKKNNPFIQRAPAATAAAATAPEPDPSTMSDEQLDKELARAREDLRLLKAQELVRTREATAEAKPKSTPKSDGSKSRFLLPNKKRRPYWK